MLISACSMPSTTKQAMPTPILMVATEASTPDIVGTLVQATMVAFQQQSAEQTAAVPSPTLEFASATPSETATLTATPTVGISNLGTPTWKDEFNVAKSWYLDDDEYTTIDIKDGSLVMTSLQPVTWTGWSLHYNQIQNFYLEGKINLPNCSAADRYGLVFRSPDYIQGYFFGVTCNGQYNLSIYNGNKFVTIIPWTPAGNINTGSNAQNTLGVKAQGNQITLSINGTELQTITNTDYQKGTYGAFIAAVNTPGFTLQMDEIAYWNLP